MPVIASCSPHWGGERDVCVCVCVRARACVVGSVMSETRDS